MHPPRTAPTANLEGALRNVLGNFCAMCERPLHQMSFAWHAGRLKTVASASVPEDWTELLPLCVNCRECAASAPPRATSAGLALPHRDRTFRLQGNSPFQYSLETVQVQHLLPDGSPAGLAEVTQKAIVTGTTPEAQATIEFFALNTPYYDRAAHTMRIAAIGGRVKEDPRVDLRTRVWETAAACAASLRKSGPALRRPLQEQLTRLAGATGFWSTWATLLWNELRDPGTLTELLLPPRDSDAHGLAAAPSAPAGSAALFPSTRADGLFNEPGSGE